MRIYRPTTGHLICGHWNDSPLEIGVTPVLMKPPETEVSHHHEYHEYYVVLHGRAELEVEERAVPLEAGTVVMVAPGERHRVRWVDPIQGARWVLVKERSAPDTKHVC